MNITGYRTAEECFVDYWDVTLEKAEIVKVNYPTELTLDKTTAKAGDTITVTSSKPFFDTTTFSEYKTKVLTFVFSASFDIIIVS